MSFTTIDKVTNFLNRNTSGLGVDETNILNMLILNIDGVIRNYCGWAVLAQDYDKLFDGNGSEVLDLKVYPINTLTKLEIDDVDYTSEVTLNVEDGELYFLTTAGQKFTAGYRNVHAEFNAGLVEVPSDLEFAASWLVVTYFNRIDLENIGVLKERFNDTEVEYDTTDLPVLVKHTLDRYRKIGIF
jgi:hypothetical protein